MSDEEELGPIDYIVIEFPPGKMSFDGSLTDELVALTEAGIIRIMDILVLVKDESGAVEAFEIDDLEDAGAIAALETELAEILAAEDVDHLAAAMEPGSVAGVLIWENTWAAPFAVAARRSGGQLIASGRIPTQALIAAFEADEELTEGD